MWQCDKNASLGRDHPIYFKTDRPKHTLPVPCVHIIKPILWLAEPASALLYIWRIYTKPFLSSFPFTAGVTDADRTQWLNKQLCYLKKYTHFASKMFGVIPRERKKNKSDQQREGTTLKRTHSCFFSGHKSLSTLALINWSSSNPPGFLWKPRIKDDYNISNR